MTVSVADLVSDFRAECDALDGLLRGLTAEQWLVATPAAGWDVRDSITHLAISNELASDCVVTGKSDLMDRVLAGGAIEEYEVEHLQRGRASSGPEVGEWWRESNAAVAAAVAAADPDARVPWGPTRMSLASFITARLMETWAHGLDCFAAADVAPVDTDRLRHIANIGWRTLGYAFSIKGLPTPGPVRLDLTGPAGDTWQFGTPDAPSWVAGTASDWCRVATNRDRDGERDRLRTGGPDGAAVVANAQAYLSA
jgi:uncharacterized protein (TIGR03084 family)